MSKVNRQNIVDELIKSVEAGADKTTIVAEIGKKWPISIRTFDRYWKKATEEYARRQHLAKEAANNAYIETVVEATKEAVMSEMEAKKLITDIARSNLADYMIIKTVEYRPRLEISLADHIVRLEEECRFEDEFAKAAKYSKEEMKAHRGNQAMRERNILRHKMKLTQNPQETIIVDGPVEWRESVELDLVKLVADKERGKIKSFEHTRYGVKVEMYSADAAQTTILKLYGSFPPAKVQTQQLGKDGKPIDPVTPQLVINQVAGVAEIVEKEEE